MNTAAQAFIAFLRCEAKQSEERAKSLRATAAAIEANNLEAQRKKRRRETNSNKTKKPHTAYTLFVRENYDSIRRNHLDLPSKDIMVMMASQWAATSVEEKQTWKERVEQLRKDDQQFDDDIEGLPEPPSDVDENRNGTNHVGGGIKQAVVARKSDISKPCPV